MKREKIVLHNFRGFAGRTEISISEITTLVGRNDAGKSSVLDPLGTFLANGLAWFASPMFEQFSIEP